MSLKYHQLDSSVEKQIKENISKGILSSYRFMDENAVRRNMEKDKNSVLRPSFGRDIEKILHLPLYNRYNDKTQVFSFYNNDDITRRGLHVQLVSRISRNIGRMLGLNLDLIESIALGHDVGHTPFGHAGERYLSELLQKETGRHFNHNVHSIRVLDILYRRNISLQTLDGILCHNGEFELNEYRPQKGLTFEQYDNNVELCYTEGGEAIKKLVPSTLEGCVVRICDILAYIGKDRQGGILFLDFGFGAQHVIVDDCLVHTNGVLPVVTASGKLAGILDAGLVTGIHILGQACMKYHLQKNITEFFLHVFISTRC